MLDDKGYIMQDYEYFIKGILFHKEVVGNLSGNHVRIFVDNCIVKGEKLC